MDNIEVSSGSHVQPHIESSDSELEESSCDSDISESDEDVEHLNNENGSESMCFVAPDGSKYWTPKCDDNHKTYVNQFFPTLEDAYLFYREYGRICGFDVRKSTNKTDRRGNLYAKNIQCSRVGSPCQNKSKPFDLNVVEGPRRRTTSKRCNCKAHIIMKPLGDKGFVVMRFLEEHNHDFASGSGKMFLRCNRNVSNVYQNFIMDYSRSNIGVTRAHSLAKEMTESYEDVGATIADFKNFSRDVKVRIGDHNADMILSKFKLKKESSNNTFYYDYKVNRTRHLTSLFWTDAIGQANFVVFGDIVSFDPTFRTNRYNMVFVPFTGVDNHWKNITFVAGLLANEKYKNFKWLINSFKKAMGRVSSCVITGQCPVIKKALAKWWPSSKHRLCMWHIMNKLLSKVGPVMASNKKFVDKLKSVVYCDHLSPSEFEERWEALISEYKLESNIWFTKMYSMRSQWIPAYFSDIEMAGLLRTTSRSESSNFFFQHFHESGDTLMEFYSSFESSMEKQRIRTAEDDKRSQEIPQVDTTMTIELDASKLYTLELYYLVREEIKSACFHTTMEAMTRDDDARHFKCKDELLHDHIFEVSVRHSDNSVNCTYKFYYRRGYLCKHAFAALHQCSVKHIPRDIVKARWTKNAVKQYSFLGSSEVSANFDKKDRTKLKKTRAWFEFQTIINHAGEDEEKVDTIITGPRSIDFALTKKSRTNTEEGSAHRADKFIGVIRDAEVG